MAQLMLVNPRKRRKATTKKRKTTAKRRTATKRRTPAKRTTRSYRRNPVTPLRKRRRYKRNPMKKGFTGLLSPVMPAAISATGAIGLDLAWGMIGSKLPAQLATGPAMHVTKALGALGLGVLAGMVAKKDTANQLATGALTVVLHGAMKDGIETFAPGVNLGEYVGMDGLAEYVAEMDGVGQYVDYGNAIGYAGGGTYGDPVNMSGLGEYDTNDLFSM